MNGFFWFMAGLILFPVVAVAALIFIGDFLDDRR